ncbi:hypothetical protein AB4392_03385 [Vibrio breoganii]
MSDKHTDIIFADYQAQNTLGREIQQRHKPSA